MFKHKKIARHKFTKEDYCLKCCSSIKFKDTLPITSILKTNFNLERVYCEKEANQINFIGNNNNDSEDKVF